METLIKPQSNITLGTDLKCIADVVNANGFNKVKKGEEITLSEKIEYRWNDSFSYRVLVLGRTPRFEHIELSELKNFIQY